MIKCVSVSKGLFPLISKEIDFWFDANSYKFTTESVVKTANAFLDGLIKIPVFLKSNLRDNLYVNDLSTFALYEICNQDSKYGLNLKTCRFEANSIENIGINKSLFLLKNSIYCFKNLINWNLSYQEIDQFNNTLYKFFNNQIIIQTLNVSVEDLFKF